MKGKYFPDYFDNPEMVDKSLKDMIRRGSHGEWKWNIRDKGNNPRPVIVKCLRSWIKKEKYWKFYYI